MKRMASQIFDLGLKTEIMGFEHPKSRKSPKKQAEHF